MVTADVIYSEAKNLASMLLVEGQDEWANKITEAIETGSTGSEIMMSLRWNIENLLKEPTLSEGLKTKSKTLHSNLNEALEV